MIRYSIPTEILVLLLTMRSIKVTASCYNADIYDSSGSVACPANANEYQNNMDVQWVLHASGVKLIKFQSFVTEACCDKVSIYETTSATNATEKFRLSGSGESVLTSEFWIPGPAVVRFKTDHSVTASGFRFTFETNYSSDISVATELIRHSTGQRTSHANFGSGTYPDNYRLARSIQCPPDGIISIRFLAFITESCCDQLKIFPGLFSYSGSEVLHQYSGNRSEIPYLHLPYSVTLMFSTDGSVVHSGFKFDFSVDKIDTLLHSWNGMASGGSFSIRLPSILASPIASCKLRNSCLKQSIDVAPTNKTLSSAVEVFLFELWKAPEISPPYCITSVSCTVRSASFSAALVERNFGSIVSNPQSVSIELINPELWSQSGLIQFYATSQPACPNVRHRCELRSTNGEVSRALQISSDTRPGIRWCSVKTLFRLAVPLRTAAIPTAIVACLKLDRSYDLKSIILDDQRITWNFTNWTGVASSGSFSVTVDPGMGIGSVRCSVKNECGEYLPIHSFKLVSKRNEAVFNSDPTAAPESCVSEVLCKFSAPNGWTRDSSVRNLTAQPRAVMISLIDEASWSPSGFRTFVAISDNVCPTVQHHCELSSSHDSSQPTDVISIRRIPANSSCGTASYKLRTIFSVPKNVTVLENSYIKCEKAGGEFEVQLLKSDARRHAERLEKIHSGQRSLLLPLSITGFSLFTAVTSVLVVVTLVRRRRANTAAAVSYHSGNKATGGEASGRAEEVNCLHAQNELYVCDSLEVYVV